MTECTCDRRAASATAEPFGARRLLLEVGQGRHAAVRRHMIDDLRQHSRELIQQFLLAHAGALRQFGKHILAEGRTELSRLNRLIRARGRPRN